MNVPNHYFLVTSQGHCATTWLASALNLHPEITCSHGINHPIDAMSHYYNLRNGEVPREWLERLLAEPELGRHGVEPHTLGRVQSVADELGQEPLKFPERHFLELSSFLFEELEEWCRCEIRRGDGRVLGNVHGVTLTNYHAHLDRADTPYGGRKLRVVDLIRHPVSRFQSALNRGVGQYRDPGFKIEVDRAIAKRERHIRRLEKQYGIEIVGTDLQIFYFYTYVQNVNKWWADEVRNFRCKRETTERIVSDPGILSDLIRYLSADSVDVGKDYLDQVYSERHMAAGRKGGQGAPPTPEEVYAAWNEWQRATYRSLMRSLSLRSAYRAQGYDFSFVL